MTRAYAALTILASALFLAALAWQVGSALISLL